jgi:hypothetical protein
MNLAWSVAVVTFLALQTSCAPQNSSSVTEAQAAAYQRVIDESSRQLERQRAIIERGEAILTRQEALITLQEQQAQRFNAILEKWEAMEIPGGKK